MKNASAPAKRERLVKLRKLAGITQHQLGQALAAAAKKPGVNMQSRVNTYESGARSPNVTTAQAYITTLNKLLAKAGVKDRAKLEDLV